MRIATRIRNMLLSSINRKSLRHLVKQIPSGVVPVYFIFTPEIIHLAPFCVPRGINTIHPILLMNAVSDEDVAWVSSVLPQIPLVKLRTSLTDNRTSLLPHGTVLTDLLESNESQFCIQDPDCFVTDPDFWSSIQVDDCEFVAAVFLEMSIEDRHVLPQTYFLFFNTENYKRISRKYGVDAGVVRKMPVKACDAIRRIGYVAGQYPQAHKDYFDTLQAYWVLSLAEGLKCRTIRGERECVFHIGGTSYLHNSNYDLSHWDYWPLSVHYLNLRLLAVPILSRFRDRYLHLFKRYGTSEDLLATFPLFRDGWRRKEIDHIFESCKVNAAACGKIDSSVIRTQAPPKCG